MTAPFSSQRPLLTTVILLALSLVTAAAAQNSESGQNTPPNTNRQAATLNQLLSGQGRALLAQPVTLANVAIQAITRSDILWLGASPENSVMVMLQPSVNPIDARGNPTPMAEGDRVRMTGHVIAAPSSKLLQSWGVKPADAARVQRQGVVLQATILEVTKRNQ